MDNFDRLFSLFKDLQGKMGYASSSPWSSGKPVSSRKSSVAQKDEEGWRRIDPEFELSGVRCQEEVNSWLKMREDEYFLDRVKGWFEHIDAARREARLSLLTSAYHVDRIITPGLYRLIKRVMSNLRLVQEVDVYIVSSSTLNAFCVAARKSGRLVLGIHSALIELLSEKELMFAIGHEIGHAILDHAEIPPGDFEDRNFSFLENVKLRNLGRHMEISADRVGLLACQDFNVAGSALFKLVSGLSDRWVKFDPDAYERQIETIQQNIDLLKIENQGLTHPITPLRVKALKIFEQSEIFAAAFGSENFEIPAIELEKRIDHLLDLVEPDISSLEVSDIKTHIDNFLECALISMMAIDDDFCRREKDWLQEKWKIPAEKIAEIIEIPDYRDRLLAIAGNEVKLIRNSLNFYDRYKLFEILCAGAYADGKLVDPEVEMLKIWCELLEINIEDGNHALREIGKLVLAENDPDQDSTSVAQDESRYSELRPGDWVKFKVDALIAPDHVILQGMVGQVVVTDVSHLVCTPGISTMIQVVGRSEPFGYFNTYFVALKEEPEAAEKDESIKLCDSAYALFEQKNGYTGYIKIGNKLEPEEKVVFELKTLSEKIPLLVDDKSKEIELKGLVKRLKKVLRSFGLHPFAQSLSSLADEIEKAQSEDLAKQM